MNLTKVKAKWEDIKIKIAGKKRRCIVMIIIFALIAMFLVWKYA